MSSKKIIIVGATSGIGRALAELYLQAGCTVGVTGRREQLLAELISAYPGRAFPRAFDVTDTASCTGHLDALVDVMGGVDTIVISAGGGSLNEPLDLEIERKAVVLNVHAFTEVTVWAFHRLAAQGGGHLAAISSVAGTRGSRQAPAYSATKAFQIAYLEGLQQKAKKQGGKVCVTDIRPGFVRTKPAGDQAARFWEADVSRAARQIYRGMARRKRVVYVTRRWRLVALIYRLAPRWLLERL